MCCLKVIFCLYVGTNSIMHLGSKFIFYSVGCYADVIHYMDSMCSGRHKCDVTIRKLTEIAEPCPADLANHLEASYDCVPGQSFL